MVAISLRRTPIPRRVEAGRLGGVPLLVDLPGVLALNATNFAVVLLLCRVARPEWSPLAWAGVAAAVALLLQLSALAHELAHLAGAVATGQPVRELGLTAFGGYVWVEVDDDGASAPGATALYVAAGPLASLGLWLLFDALAVVARGADLPAAALALSLAGALNAVLLVLNLLPVGAFDGGRLLRLALGPGRTRLPAAD